VPASQKLGMVAVIPVFNEPALLNTINSLASCAPPAGDVEVFAVVNQSETSPSEIEKQNNLTILEVEAWKKQNLGVFFQLHLLKPPPFRKKHAGAGLARKTGMDEAVRRFAAIENEDGIIISLDADTVVNENYFVEIEKYFFSNKKHVGATLKFKHRVEEIEDERHRQGIKLYEIYLHYYKNAMAFTGFPNAIYTVGSAFAVRAGAYVKQGGMNRKQAGEDFYFLHKLAQLGKIGEINSACVYPSARISNRVPFGTGPVLQKWMQGDESLRLAYNFRAFQGLKQLFDQLPGVYKSSEFELKTLLEQLPVALSSFLKEEEFEKALLEISTNASRFDSFQKRFFLWFNAFKILKFLNFAHPGFYPFQDLEEASRQLKL
jgi:hypothetical protein